MYYSTITLTYKFINFVYKITYESIKLIKEYMFFIKTVFSQILCFIRAFLIFKNHETYIFTNLYFILC